MAFDLVWEPSGVWRRYSGRLTAADLLASLNQVQIDPRYDRLRYSLNDFLAVESVDDVSGIMDVVIAGSIGGAYSNPRLVMAIVARHESVLAHAGMFIRPDFPYPVKIFQEIDAARAWLGASGAQPQME